VFEVLRRAIYEEKGIPEKIRWAGRRLFAERRTEMKNRKLVKLPIFGFFLVS